MSVDPERVIAEIIGKEINQDPSTITPDKSLDSLGVHSLELVEIIMTIEEQFDVTIEMDAVTARDNIKTVGDLLAVGKELGIGG